MVKLHLSNLFKPHLILSRRFNLIRLVPIVTFAVIGGIVLLVATHAATPTVSIEPENGTLSGVAQVVTDSTASSGKAVKFGSKAGILAPLPAKWPTTLQLGIADAPGDASVMKTAAPFGFRYQYLAGGVNTGSGWSTWNSPSGAFVTNYIQESVNNSIIPFFSYYQMLQSNPATGSNEGDKDFNNMQNVSSMTAYYNDIKLFMQKAGTFPNNMVVFQVEPDLWGYLEQKSTGDDASTVTAQVATTGLTELSGIPNNVAGFAKAIVKLRDTYAPNVVLAYHLSDFGTGVSLIASKPDNPTTIALATRSGNFFKSMQAGFDITTWEIRDRDADFYSIIYGNPNVWMSSSDYDRHVLYLATFSQVTNKRVILWQLPLGNTKMLAQNNTWGHFQDNLVETVLGDPTKTYLNKYLNSGVVAFLFGGGASGTTCACDADNDGVTNPAPITTTHNGATTTTSLQSLSADDDGGYFRQQAKAYYTGGALALP